MCTEMGPEYGAGHKRSTAEKEKCQSPPKLRAHCGVSEETETCEREPGGKGGTEKDTQRCIKRAHAFTVVISSYYQQLVSRTELFCCESTTTGSWPMTVSFTLSANSSLSEFIAHLFFHAPHWLVSQNPATIHSCFSFASCFFSPRSFIGADLSFNACSFSGRTYQTAVWSKLMFIDRKINEALIQEEGRREEVWRLVEGQLEDVRNEQQRVELIKQETKKTKQKQDKKKGGLGARTGVFVSSLLCCRTAAEKRDSNGTREEKGGGETKEERRREKINFPGQKQAGLMEVWKRKRRRHIFLWLPPVVSLTNLQSCGLHSYDLLLKIRSPAVPEIFLKIK